MSRVTGVLLQRERQTLGGPAGFHELIERQRVSLVPARLQPFHRVGAALRQHDVLGDADRVAGKTEGLFVSRPNRGRRTVVAYPCMTGFIDSELTAFL